MPKASNWTTLGFNLTWIL